MSDVLNGMQALTDFVRMTTDSGAPRKALLLRTERLPSTLSRPERLRRARAALDPLNAAERVRWYDLPGGRIVVIWKGDQTQLVGRVIDALTRVLLENPAEARSLQELIALFDLPKSADALLTAARTGLPIVLDEIMHRRSALALEPLEPAELDRLEQRLASTDMSRFARRRPVSYYDGVVAQLAWEERTLSIPELIETVAPGRDARSDVWLFRRLTRLLDRRMLSILSDPRELRAAGPFSITLNVASVLSPEFLRFDAALPSYLRPKVVISFLPADVASDAGAFAFARNFARGRSYRVALRAVSAALLPALDFAKLELDLIQLIWSAELAAVDKLPDPGRANWVVGQPCTRDAVDWGVSHDINLFTIKPTD